MNIKKYLESFYKAFLSPSKPKISFSQYGEDLLIQSYFKKNKTHGHYVDVGCHHPRRGSNTYGLYKKGWSGVLIDLEEIKVLSNRWARPRDKVFLSAISDQEEIVEIYTDKNYSTNTSISRQNISVHSASIGKIKTRTLSSLLDEINYLRDFELLSIDVEGVDLKVLKGLDLSRYRPTLICIENWAAQQGIDAILKSDIHNYLVINQYEMLAWSGLSTLYKRIA